MPAVSPKCKQGHFPYLDANGKLFPCCWIATVPRLVRSFLGDDLYQQLNASRYGVDEIMNSNAMAKIESTWIDGSFDPCVEHCGYQSPSDSVTSVDEEITINLERGKDE